MNKKLLVAALFAVAGTSAMAQSAFNGAYGQVGIGYSSASPSTSNATQTVGGSTVNRSISSSSSSDFTGTVTVGYMGTVSNNFLLGIGAEYSPLPGSSTNSTASGGGFTTTTSTYKVQNGYNIFLSPAIAIDKDKLAYAKVGYAGTQIKVDYGSGNNTTNYTGYSLGLGYKQIIQGGLYGFAEGNYFSYGNKTTNLSGTTSGTAWTTSQTSNANAYNLLVGIGYKF
jgi:outer membrane immunogenic protein